MYPLEKMSEEVELDNEILKGVSSRDTVVVTKGTQALSLWEDECDGMMMKVIGVQSLCHKSTCSIGKMVVILYG